MISRLVAALLRCSPTFPTPRVPSGISSSRRSTNDLTTAFCASSDCQTLTNSIVSFLANCTVSPGGKLVHDGIKCHQLLRESTDACANNSKTSSDNSSGSKYDYCRPKYHDGISKHDNDSPNTGADCDASINAANNWTLSQACTNDLQGGSPLSLSAIYADIAARSSTTVYRYGLCGSTNCAADIAKIVNSYPNCTATTAPSLLTWVQGYAPTCVAVNASIANSTCTLANYADYNWARYQVQLTPQCANALSMSTSSLWYSAIQAAALTNSAFTNAFCNSADCIALTTRTTSMLGNCNVTSSENLYKTATSLINFCNIIAPTSSPPTTTITATPSTTSPTAGGTTAAPSTTSATAGGSTTMVPTPTPSKSSASTMMSLAVVALVSGVVFLA
ncbi:unnamed protein product [Aphanomyces euteiches]